MLQRHGIVGDDVFLNQTRSDVTATPLPGPVAQACRLHSDRVRLHTRPVSSVCRKLLLLAPSAAGRACTPPAGSVAYAALQQSQSVLGLGDAIAVQELRMRLSVPELPVDRDDWQPEGPQTGLFSVNRDRTGLGRQVAEMAGHLLACPPCPPPPRRAGGRARVRARAAGRFGVGLRVERRVPLSRCRHAPVFRPPSRV